MRVILQAIAAASVVVSAASPMHAIAQNSAPFSDIFTSDAALNSGWLLSQPNPSSHYSIGADGLLMGVSGQHGGSGLWLGTNFRASLLLQPIAPDADWQITVHFCFMPIIDFQAAGIVLTSQPGNFTAASAFHRYELSYQIVHGGLAVSSYTNGPIDPGFAPYHSNLCACVLRLDKI